MSTEAAEAAECDLVRQQEEMEALSSIYLDDLTITSDDAFEINISDEQKKQIRLFSAKREMGKHCYPET